LRFRYFSKIERRDNRSHDAVAFLNIPDIARYFCTHILASKSPLNLKSRRGEKERGVLVENRCTILPTLGGLSLFCPFEECGDALSRLSDWSDVAHFD
jgi:hypothetical protein